MIRSIYVPFSLQPRIAPLNIMVLCNRFNPSNQETNTNLSNPTCLIDTIFLPLPALVLAFLVALSLVARRKSIHAGTWPKEKHESLERPTSRAMSVVHWLDLALVFCQGGMQILEIARLAISNEGVGLLPITLAGILLAFLLIFFHQKPADTPNRFAGHLSLFFLLMMVLEAVKVGLWAAVGNQTLGPSTYRSSDKVADLAVLLALYALSLGSQLYKIVAARRIERL